MAAVRRASILDVAAEAGVSKSAASRALLEQAGVSEELKMKVRAAAERLGYVKDFRAHALKSVSTKTIGVLVRTVRFDFYAELIALMQTQIEAAGYRIVFMGASTSDPGSRTALANLVGLRPEAIAVASGRVPIPALERLAQQLPVTVIGPQAPSPLLSSIADDDFGAVELARAVAQAGHRNVGVLAVPAQRSLTLNRRSERIRAELAGLGLGVVDIEPEDVEDAPAADSLRNAVGGVTAVMCPNDPALIATWELLQHWGLSVPEDVSLTGYDGIGQLASPVLGLTTWRQGLEEMASAAATEVLRRVQDPASEPRHVSVRGALLRGRTLGDHPDSHA